VRKAVVTAAGRGSRHFPATRTVQKELIPLVDVDGYVKPTLQIILEDVLRSGIDDICVIANAANAGPIRAHFTGVGRQQLAEEYGGKDWIRSQSETLAEIGRRLTVVVQPTQEGYGHAVYQAREWTAGEPFVLLTGDHVNVAGGAGPAPRQVVDVYEAHGATVSSVARVAEADVSRYGTAAAEPIAGGVYRMRELVEKPSAGEARARLKTPGVPDGYYLCFYGIHVFSALLFDCLEEMVNRDMRERGELQLATAQHMLLARGPYLLAEIEAEQYDMGTPEGLVRTQTALALHSPFRSAVSAQLSLDCDHAGAR
jgi:UTP--glucose-1-phosphate uridylyltransferase